MSMQKRNVKTLKSNSGEEYLKILNEDIKKVSIHVIFAICDCIIDMLLIFSK
jgi:hypothetical protein